ncbi:hypothetical protein ACB092_07G109200 [Castanea dentata]
MEEIKQSDDIILFIDEVHSLIGAGAAEGAIDAANILKPALARGELQWWEKSDWIGYKELGVEKSGRNAEGDSWWETWQENLHQDEWSNLGRIERSAQKQAKSGTENAGWYEKWWEKYDAKGWTEKKAYKYGRLNEQSWWEKWGEQYDGRGSVLKWTDKWAETMLGTKWGDKWEDKFFAGIGSRQGETWHVTPGGELIVSCLIKQLT